MTVTGMSVYLGFAKGDRHAKLAYATRDVAGRGSRVAGRGQACQATFAIKYAADACRCVQMRADEG